MHPSALLIEEFLEWARLSIANFQPEEKTAGTWAHKELGLIFPSMNGKAGIKRVLWSRKCGRVRGPEVNPDTSRAFDTATLTPGRCGPVVVRCLLVRLAAPLGEEKKEGKSGRSSLPAPNWKDLKYLWKLFPNEP